MSNLNATATTTTKVLTYEDLIVTTIEGWWYDGGAQVEEVSHPIRVGDLHENERGYYITPSGVIVYDHPAALKRTAYAVLDSVGCDGAYLDVLHVQVGAGETYTLTKYLVKVYDPWRNNKKSYSIERKEVIRLELPWIEPR